MELLLPDTGCRQQIYMMGVVGPVFFCFLATRRPQQKSLSARELCTLLLRTQMHMLNSPIPMVATYCHHCGRRDPHLSPMNADLRPKHTIKVSVIVQCTELLGITVFLC